MFIDHGEKIINSKVAYYGPESSGKTTNLQFIYNLTPPHPKTEQLVKVATKMNQDGGFDLELRTVRGYKTRLHLYTIVSVQLVI